MAVYFENLTIFLLRLLDERKKMEKYVVCIFLYVYIIRKRTEKKKKKSFEKKNQASYNIVARGDFEDVLCI